MVCDVLVPDIKIGMRSCGVVFYFAKIDYQWIKIYIFFFEIDLDVLKILPGNIHNFRRISEKIANEKYALVRHLVIFRQKISANERL